MNKFLDNLLALFVGAAFISSIIGLVIVIVLILTTVSVTYGFLGLCFLAVSWWVGRGILSNNAQK